MLYLNMEEPPAKRLNWSMTLEALTTWPPAFYTRGIRLRVTSSPPTRSPLATMQSPVWSATHWVRWECECWHYSPDLRVLGRVRARGEHCAGPRREDSAMVPGHLPTEFFN